MVVKLFSVKFMSCHLLHHSVFALAFFNENFQGLSNILGPKFTSNELVEEMW